MSPSKVCTHVSLLVVALGACGGDESVGPAGDAESSMAIVSGAEQRGLAGETLDEPLVVRVADGRDDGIEGVRVAWRVISGAGSFGADESGDTAATVTTPTDADGFARRTFRPTWRGPVRVTASVPGLRGSPSAFRVDAALGKVALTAVEGPERETRAGESMPLEVRVTSARSGTGIGNVDVDWRVVSGAGRLSDALTSTNSEGIARAYFRADALGRSEVAASVVEMPGSEAMFTTDARGVLIWLVGDEFVVPGDAPDLTIPVGTPVAWACWCDTWHLVATAVPPGGASFDTGALRLSDHFEFVPDVAGTWEYVDEISGATGSFTTSAAAVAGNRGRSGS